jgi:hypothetical protein
MAFLTILAGHSKLPAVNRYADLRHFSWDIYPCCIDFAISQESYFIRSSVHAARAARGFVNS